MVSIIGKSYIIYINLNTNNFLAKMGLMHLLFATTLVHQMPVDLIEVLGIIMFHIIYHEWP